MGGEGAALGEGVPAGVALVGFLPRVGADMDGEGALGGEGVPAGVAEMRPSSRMVFLVVLE